MEKDAKRRRLTNWKLVCLDNEFIGQITKTPIAMWVRDTTSVIGEVISYVLRYGDWVIKRDDNSCQAR